MTLNKQPGLGTAFYRVQWECGGRSGPSVTVQELAAEIDALKAENSEIKKAICEIHGQTARTEEEVYKLRQVVRQPAYVPLHPNAIPALAFVTADKKSPGSFAAAEIVSYSKTMKSDISSARNDIPLGNNALRQTNEYRPTSRESFLAEDTVDPSTLVSGYNERFLRAGTTSDAMDTNSDEPRVRQLYDDVSGYTSCCASGTFPKNPTLQSAQAAAKSLCIMRRWQIANPSLHKILYLAQIIHLGETGQPMIAEHFEATDCGPILPQLYRQLRGYGARHIGNIGFLKDEAGLPPSSSAYQTLQRVSDMTRHYNPGELVAAVHHKDGAFAKYYRPGRRLRGGIQITIEDMLAEYRQRKGKRKICRSILPSPQ